MLLVLVFLVGLCGAVSEPRELTQDNWKEMLNGHWMVELSVGLPLFVYDIASRLLV
jgi:hypothetical protein